MYLLHVDTRLKIPSWYKLGSSIRRYKKPIPLLSYRRIVDLPSFASAALTKRLDDPEVLIGRTARGPVGLQRRDEWLRLAANPLFGSFQQR